MGRQLNQTPSVVTPGNHDGVHLGHRALLAAAHAIACDADAHLRVVAMSFDPHPIQLVAPDRAPALLTTLERRAELLRAAGADEVVVHRFDREFAALSPEEFVQGPLRGDLCASAVVVGDDFRFGADRAGDVASLESMGAREGFAVRVVPKVLLDGEPISSSRVRKTLQQGDVAQVTRLLGRVHDVDRSVIDGHKVGRTLGFRTANLELKGTLLPADGVYAVVARLLDDAGVSAGPIIPGVANLGDRPTVQGGRAFEAHLLDYEGDLYGRALRVGFVARLRDEVRFDDLIQLREQISRDVQAARAAIEACDPESLRWM